MANYNFYGKIDSVAWHLKVNDCTTSIDIGGVLWKSSTTVYAQGPKNGVILMKDSKYKSRGYVTRNKKIMKEFMWLKLTATSLN